MDKGNLLDYRNHSYTDDWEKGVHIDAHDQWGAPLLFTILSSKSDDGTSKLNKIKFLLEV